MASGELKEGWSEVLDEDGDPYFWNEATGETTWERPVAKKAAPPPPPNKPPKPPKPPRDISPNARPTSTVGPMVGNSNATNNAREMQRLREEAAERERKEELRNAQLRSERQFAQSAAVTFNKDGAAAVPHEYSKAAVVNSVNEIKLDSHVNKWTEGAAESSARGRGVSMSFASMRGKSPTRLSPTRGTSGSTLSPSGGGGGYSLAALARGTAGAVNQERYPSGMYRNKGDCDARRQALNVLCLGQYDFKGKRLHIEGPLSKRNRDGMETYQHILTDTDLLYFEAVSGKERYQLRKAYPLATLRVVADVVGANQDGLHLFQIMNPAKSWVASAPTAAAKSTWLQKLEELGRAACGVAGRPYDNDPTLKLATVWAENSSVKACELCSRDFTLLTRKHHCRNCGKVVCGTCSAEKMRLEHISKEEFLRVCSKCYQENKLSATYGVNNSSSSSSSSSSGYGAARPASPPQQQQQQQQQQQHQRQQPPPPAVPPRAPAAVGSSVQQQVEQPPPPPPPPPPPAPAPPVAPPPPAAPAAAGGAPNPPPPPALFSLEELQGNPPPPGVDPGSKELYLLNDKFSELFGCDKAAFQKLPAWQRANKKKANGLF